MKKSMLAALIMMMLAVSCRHMNDGNISVSVTDSDDFYKVKADYDESRTSKLYRYIRKNLGSDGLFQSEDDHLDAVVQLDDHTRFYVKASPGKFLLKMDKDENSEASYDRIRKVGEGIKKVLAD